MMMWPDVTMACALMGYLDGELESWTKLIQRFLWKFIMFMYF